MKFSKIYVVSIIFAIIGMSFTQSLASAVAYEQIVSELKPAAAPTTKHIIGQDYLTAFTYTDRVRNGKSIKFKIQLLERTSGLSIKEGDKRLKEGDRININIEADPYLNLNHPDEWALIYVNDVKALYPSASQHIARLFHYILPTDINLTLVGFVQDLGLDGSMFGDYPVGTSQIDFWDFVNYFVEENHTDFQEWEIKENTAVYEYEQIIDNGEDDAKDNSTHTMLIYDKRTSLLNEYYYEENYYVEGELVGSVNMTMVRTHGWGLPYNVTTLVVWIPLALFFVGLILAFRFNLFQRIKLYFEAKRLSQRE